MNLLTPPETFYNNILLAEKIVANFSSETASFSTDLTNATKEAIAKEDTTQSFKHFTKKTTKSLDGFRNYMRTRRKEGNAISKQKQKDKMKTITNPILPKSIQATRRRQNLITSNTDISPTIL